MAGAERIELPSKVLETPMLPLYHAPMVVNNQKIFNKNIISCPISFYQYFSYYILGDYMIINYTTKELELLARLMRAEALGEGNLGMLMVGNVVVNRALAECLTFKDIRSITDDIYQKNQFTGTQSSLFNGTPTTLEKNLAQRVLRGEYYHPATNSLWFYAPPTNTSCKNTWYDQNLAGRYKNHCFYIPDPGICKQLH